MHGRCLPPRLQDTASNDADSVNHHFIKAALPHLVPLLLEQLTKQEEGQEMDDSVWNVSMAAGTCLALCASVAGDAIVPLVMPYVTAGIQKTDGEDSWRAREAATFAFGSILEGPGVETLGQLVQSGLGFLLTALKQDPNAHVKDTTAWTIGGRGVALAGCLRRRRGTWLAALCCGVHSPAAVVVLLHCSTHTHRPTGAHRRTPSLAGRIFEFVHGEDATVPLLGPGNLPQVVQALLHAIQDTPHIAEKVGCCGAAPWGSQHVFGWACAAHINCCQ